MHMGGAQEKLELKMIGDVDAGAFTTFDADKAKCFNKADREKLLAVVEAAFGDIERFNQAVRKMLINAVHAKLEKEVSTLGMDVKAANWMIACMDAPLQSRWEPDATYRHCSKGRRCGKGLSHEFGNAHWAT